MTKRTFQIYRYDPDTRRQAAHADAARSSSTARERMLLDALIKLKAVDPTLELPPLAAAKACAARTR